MAITTLSEVLSYLDISRGFFEITSATNTLNFSYDGGADTNITMVDGTYDGSELATHIQELLDTAFTISSTVSYSSTTKKFTIAVEAGHTIAYSHNLSDGGLIIGLNKDHTAALSITSNEESGDPTAIIDVIREASEDYVSEYCNRTFEETAYSLERYSGLGNFNGAKKHIITLRNYPVVAVDRAVFNTLDAIRIQNTNQGTSASVSSTKTGLRLVYTGVADSSVTFTTYTTVTDVVEAINSLGNGWVAEVVSSSYAQFKSSDVLITNGLSAIDSNWVYLQIPDEGLDQFEVDTDRGHVFRYGGWPRGYRNIYIDYTAGYSTDDMPKGLKHAVKMMVQWLYQQIREDGSLGVDEYTIGDTKAILESARFPRQINMALDKYKRVLI